MTHNKDCFIPKWDMLSMELETVIHLPINKNYLIQGVHGTGKSLIALSRGSMISSINNDVVEFLVSTRFEMLYFRYLTRNNKLFNNVIIRTYHSWIFDYYNMNFPDIPVPLISTGSNFCYDWNQITNDFHRISNRISHLIIYNAEDFPLELIKELHIVAKNITCFIDPNQAIETTKTDIFEVLEEICIECPVTLMKNYSNTKDIVALSKLYWNGEGYFAEANNSAPGSRKPSVIICNDEEDQIIKIANIIHDNRGLSIGVIASTDNIDNIYKQLVSKLGDKIEITKCNSLNNIADADFFIPQIKVISYDDMNELMFDLVILTRFDKIKSSGDAFEDMKRAYIAITRARSLLYITTFGYQSEVDCVDFTPILFKNSDLIDIM